MELGATSSGHGTPTLVGVRRGSWGGSGRSGSRRRRLSGLSSSQRLKATTPSSCVQQTHTHTHKTKTAKTRAAHPHYGTQPRRTFLASYVDRSWGLASPKMSERAVAGASSPRGFVRFCKTNCSHIHTYTHVTWTRSERRPKQMSDSETAPPPPPMKKEREASSARNHDRHSRTFFRSAGGPAGSEAAIGKGRIHTSNTKTT